MNLPSPILLIGSRGMLGRAWAEALAAAGRAFETADRPRFDLARPERVVELPLRPGTLVICCAGWTDVDGAETAETAATAVNGHGIGVLAAACARRGACLVHYSTDYVFGAHENAWRPWAPDAPPAPVNAYGRSKLAGERAIEASGAEHLLLRTSWLHAPWGANFVRTILRAARTRATLQVVSDQHGRPTAAPNLVRTTAALWASGARGTFHATDGGRATWCELAREAIRIAGLPCRVDPCPSHAFPRPAPRPAWSVLDVAETTLRLGGPLTSWRKTLRETVREMAYEEVPT